MIVKTVDVDQTKHDYQPDLRSSSHHNLQDNFTIAVLLSHHNLQDNFTIAVLLSHNNHKELFCWFNPLPNDKILDWTKLKAFAEDKC